jgi:PAS domain S-box-containing protein
MTQQDLLQQLSNHKYAIDQASIVAITDSQGVITYVNDKFSEVSGYSRDELIGHTHRIVNSKYHPPSFFLDLWKTIKAGQVWRGEFRNRRKNGSYYWVDTTIVPFHDSQGHIFQFLSIRHEITPLKQAEQVIFEQQARLAVASKFSALGEMAANLTHEINNPLAAILGRCEMLIQYLQRPDVDREHLRKSIENIEFTAHRIERIIKSMRSFSVAGDGDPFELVPIKGLIEETTEFVQQRFKDYGIALKINEIDPQLTIECRSTEISQVLLNLLNNAFDAIRDLSGKWIELDVTKVANEKVQISVTDCGYGIVDHVAVRIFDPFYSTKEKQYGTGLGLSISKGLVERHEGQIELDRLSTHTRFVVTLPARQSEKNKRLKMDQPAT